jgi:hypothetical protein
VLWKFVPTSCGLGPRRTWNSPGQKIQLYTPASLFQRTYALRKPAANYWCITLKAFTGHDASEAFVLYHRRMFPHNNKKVKDAFVGKDESIKLSNQQAYDDYLELSERVSKVSREKVRRNVNLPLWT